MTQKILFFFSSVLEIVNGVGDETFPHKTWNFKPPTETPLCLQKFKNTALFINWWQHCLFSTRWFSDCVQNTNGDCTADHWHSSHTLWKWSQTKHQLMRSKSLPLLCLVELEEASAMKKLFWNSEGRQWHWASCGNSCDIICHQHHNLYICSGGCAIANYVQQNNCLIKQSKCWHQHHKNS